MTDKQYETITEAFRPRARILKLLGDQLIGSPRLAIFELVKNAYDADASKVFVQIIGVDTSEPSILIFDDGMGMNLQTIRDVWLVPAHDHRALQREEGRRTAKGRLPLGEKGVGRFAVHKLGDVIQLVTRAEGMPECVVDIDWASLIEKPYLSDALVTVRTRDPEVFIGSKTGTRILISKLNEIDWARGEIRRLNRQITSISSPFSYRSDQFDAVLEVPDHPEWLTDLPDSKALMERAPWVFVFSFENGVFEWDYQFRGIQGLQLEPRRLTSNNQGLLLVPERQIDERGQFITSNIGSRQKKLADASMADGIGPIMGTLYVFDRDREVLSMLGDSQLVQAFLDENGGVRVYRDGIRVYNYGEESDDWLNLDLRRVNTPTRNISRNIVLGAIDLSLEKSTQLLEKTNREGFVENDAYARLKKVVVAAVSVLEIERKIDKDRIRAITRKELDPGRKRISEPVEKLRKLSVEHGLDKEVDPLLKTIEQNLSEMQETMVRAGLSGLGLAIVFHEVERGVRVLSDSIERGVDSAKIGVQARELVRVLDGFSELLRKGEKKKSSLKLLVKRARDLNLVRFRHHQVKLVAPVLEDNFDDVEAVFSFGLALGALNNILDNALYWLDVRWPDENDGSKRAIYIALSHDFVGGPALVIADNGPGFQDLPEKLTHPFFSRRPAGMGLGLYYANLVMELCGGRVEFPTAAEADVPAEFDGAIVALVFGKGAAK